MSREKNRTRNSIERVSTWPAVARWGLELAAVPGLFLPRRARDGVLDTLRFGLRVSPLTFVRPLERLGEEVIDAVEARLGVREDLDRRRRRERRREENRRDDLEFADLAEPHRDGRRIVILGAGYGGLRAAHDLALARGRGELDAEIVLVDRHASHEVVTLLHQVAADTLPARFAYLPLDNLLPVEELRRVRGEVTSFDLEEHLVETPSGAIHYDHLVVALGSVPSIPPVPGLAEHALTLRTWADATRLRDHLREAFERAGRSSSEERRALLTVVVAGGGFTGCQLAGELSHWLGALAEENGVDAGEVRLILIEAAERLLASWKQKVGEEAERVLRSKGIEIFLGRPLKEVGEGSLRFDGEELTAQTTVWTGGVRAPKILEENGFATGEEGRARVDRHLRAEGHPEVRVVGDSALAMDGEEALPATAALALRQGAYVAQDLVREFSGRSTRPYRPQDLGMLVALGGTDAAGELLGVPFEGLVGGLVKEGIERGYVALLTYQLPLAETF